MLLDLAYRTRDNLHLIVAELVVEGVLDALLKPVGDHGVHVLGHGKALGVRIAEDPGVDFDLLAPLDRGIDELLHLRHARIPVLGHLALPEVGEAEPIGFQGLCTPARPICENPIESHKSLNR